MKKSTITIIILAIAAVAVAGLAYTQLTKSEPGSRRSVSNINQNVNVYDKPNPYWTVDSESWQTFVNKEYGYQIDVPPGWDTRVGPDSKQVCIGNCEGMKTYSLRISIEDNPQKYSSKDFVHWDKQYYDKEYPVVVGDGYEAYEFYNVWGGDESNEIIFLAKDDIVIRFSFSIARENTNLDNPIENNALVHEALKTFKFIEN